MRQFRSALELVAPPRSEVLPMQQHRDFRPKELRPLGAFENLFAAYNEEAALTFTMMAELHGDITKAAIERALNQVQARHPLLGVGIRRDENGHRAFVRSVGAISLKELPTGALPWELAAGLELRRPFDVEDGPLMHAAVRFEPKTVRLFFTFHHSIADGLSAVYLIRDFVRALSGERLGSFIDAASLDRRLVRLSRDYPVSPDVTGPTGVPGLPDAEAVRRWGRGMSAMPVVSSRAISRELTRRLRDVARFHDATVHAALSVALARAMSTVRDGEGPVRVISPISLRTMLGVRDECGVFIGGGKATLGTNGHSFWDEARGARGMLEPYMNSDAVHNMIGAMMGYREHDDTPAGARAGFAAAFDFDTVLANLGALPIAARYGRIRIKSIAGPVMLMSVEDEHVVGATTLEDQMQLTYTSISPLPALLERIEARLADACAAW